MKMRLSFLPFPAETEGKISTSHWHQCCGFLCLCYPKASVGEQHLRVQQVPARGAPSLKLGLNLLGLNLLGLGQVLPSCAPSQAMARMHQLHTQFCSLILTQSQLRRANEMCTLPRAAEVKMLSTKRIEEKRWANRVSGLKTISGLAGLG